MSACDLRKGEYYSYHGHAAHYEGRAAGRFLFTISTPRGSAEIRISPRNLTQEIYELQ